MDHLFVYGSLRPGASNEGVLAGVPGSWSPARLRGRLEHRGWGADLGYPALVLDPAGEVVKGDVFSSEALGPLWQALDAFEGADYQRVRAPVELEDGSVVPAFVYVLRLDRS